MLLADSSIVGTLFAFIIMMVFKPLGEIRFTVFKILKL